MWKTPPSRRKRFEAGELTYNGIPPTRQEEYRAGKVDDFLSRDAGDTFDFYSTEVDGSQYYVTEFPRNGFRVLRFQPG